MRVCEGGSGIWHLPEEGAGRGCVVRGPTGTGVGLNFKSHLTWPEGNSFTLSLSLSLTFTLSVSLWQPLYLSPLLSLTLPGGVFLTLLLCHSCPPLPLSTLFPISPPSLSLSISRWYCMLASLALSLLLTPLI